MCTLTWCRPGNGGLQVFFNRDEKKTRPIATPPARMEQDGVAFLSPRDPLGGGTWMLANEHRIVICLLNKWELERRTPKNPRSRGSLVLSMAAVKSLDDLPSILTELESYPAFSLVAFSEETERLWEWDGISLTDAELEMPLTSSSYRFPEVRAARCSAFETAGAGEHYQSSFDQEPSAYTVRMNRPDAQTWSRSHLSLWHRELRWEYLAEQPDLAGEPEKTVCVLPLTPR